MASTTASGDDNGSLRQDGARPATEKRDRVEWKRVKEKQQAIKRKCHQRLIRLRSKMAHVNNTKPMPDSYLHELNEHIVELNRMITFMEVPHWRLSREQCANLDTFERREEWFYVNTLKWFTEIYLDPWIIVFDKIHTDIHLPVDLQTPLDLRKQATFWSGNWFESYHGPAHTV